MNHQRGGGGACRRQRVRNRSLRCAGRSGTAHERPARQPPQRTPHLDPSHASQLPALLARHTAMPVTAAADGVALAPDHVYVLPADPFLTVRDGVLRLTGPVEAGTAATVIDRFLLSLAEDCGERAVGVLLSGMGAHGTRGLQTVKAEGGLVVVQDPDTADYPSMPRHAMCCASATTASASR